VSVQTGGRLGFGCASLQLAESRRVNERVLHAAWDGGVRWFDVARSYAYGAAERMLGDFLRGGRRDDAVVVTKFGIRPPGVFLRSRAVQVAARTAVGLLPSFKSRTVAAADARTAAGDFSLEGARESLHASLKALRTDHVDALLLHEPTLADLAEPTLRDWLDRCVRDGKIGCWGIAMTDIDVAGEICRQYAEATSLVQVPNSVIHPVAEWLPVGSGTTLVSHSVLTSDLAALKERLNTGPSIRPAWSDRLGFDVADTGRLAQLVLATAARSQGGVVLFSSRDADRCRQSASALGAVSTQTTSAFEHLLLDLPGS
jgi:aryl-alcohol dehydrogenase-like predicted oxidoreductase